MRRDLIVLTLAAALVGAGAEARPLRGPGAGPAVHGLSGPAGRAAIYDVRGRGFHGRDFRGQGFQAQGVRSQGVRSQGVRSQDVRGRAVAAYGGTAAAAALGVYGAAGALEPGLVAEPYVKLPRPSELVPSAWGEGTYGIPTVAGIPPQPRADPVLYVINGGERPVGGARVIPVEAPRR